MRPSDWGKITIREIRKNSGVLTRYNGSILSALKETFPEIPWQPEWFQDLKKWKHWDIQENRRKFFELFASRRKISELKDWGKITVMEIRESGGAGLLGRYNDSLYSALKDSFPGSLDENKHSYDL